MIKCIKDHVIFVEKKIVAVISGRIIFMNLCCLEGALEKAMGRKSSAL